MRRRSPKFADLKGEPRLALHACVLPPDDEEFAVRGNGVLIDDAVQRHAVAAQARDGAKLTDSMELIKINLVEVIWTQWLSDGPTHQRWSDVSNDR